MLVETRMPPVANVWCYCQKGLWKKMAILHDKIGYRLQDWTTSVLPENGPSMHTYLPLPCKAPGLYTYFIMPHQLQSSNNTKWAMLK